MFAANNLLESTEKSLKTFQSALVFSCLSIGKSNGQYHDEIRPRRLLFVFIHVHLGGFSIESTTTVCSGKDFHIALLI